MLPFHIYAMFWGVLTGLVLTPIKCRLIVILVLIFFPYSWDRMSVTWKTWWILCTRECLSIDTGTCNHFICCRYLELQIKVQRVSWVDDWKECGFLLGNQFAGFHFCIISRVSSVQFQGFQTWNQGAVHCRNGSLDERIQVCIYKFCARNFSTQHRNY